MSVQTKSRRRLKILLAAVLGVGALGVGAVFARKYQISQRVEAGREEGYAAIERREYFTALHKIGPYLQRNPDDMDALLKYAEARRNVEEPNGRHLTDAIALYRRVLEREPDQEEARKQLLELYIRTGFNTEILVTTENRDDAVSTRARAIALANLGRNDEAQPVIDRYLAGNPLDLQMQLFTVMHMQRIGRPGTAIVEHVDRIASENPPLPQFDLLRSVGNLLAGDRDAAARHLEAAISKPITDPDHVEVVVDLFDSLERYEESLAFLQRVSSLGDDPKFARRVASRLFESGRNEQLIERLASIEAEGDRADTTLLAYKALALAGSGDKEAARRLAAILEGRQGDFTARAWGSLVMAELDGGDAPDEQRIVTATRDGLRNEPNNPYFRLRLGDAYNRLGEPELALAEWSAAATAARAWREPVQRLTEAAISLREPTLVLATTTRLEQLAGDSPEAMSVLAVGRTQLIAMGAPGRIDDVLPSIDPILQRDPSNANAIELKSSILSSLGRRDEARSFLEARLASDAAEPLGTHLALFRVSQQLAVELGQRVLDRAMAQLGSQPTLARISAGIIVRTESAEKALERFDELRTQSPEGQAVEWQLARAQLLDELQSDLAAEAWTKLADERPADFRVQRLAMSSPSVRANVVISERILARMKELVGPEGVTTRVTEAGLILARARDQTAVTDREREAVRATALLNDVIRVHPSQIQARQLMIEGLTLLGRTADATNQLAEVVRLSPGRLAPRLQLATRLQSAGDFEGALPVIEQAAAIIELRGSPGSPPTDDVDYSTGVRVLASLFAARGDSARAIDMLRRLDGELSVDGTNLDLAQMLSAQGRLDAAMIDQLLDQPTPRSIELVAEHYARINQLDQADAVLARLDTIEAEPGQREAVVGLYRLRRGQYALAIDPLRAATQSMPDRPEIRRALLQALVAEGQADEAVATLTELQRQMPGDQAMGRLTDMSLMREAIALPRIRPLVLAMVVGGADSATLAEAVRIAVEGGRREQTTGQVLDGLRPLAQRSPGLAPLQYLVIDLELASGNVDAALAIGARLMQLAPSDPLPAQRVAQLFAGSGRWDEVVPAAEAWKSRLGSFTRPADLLLAEAYIRTERAGQALNVLAAYRDEPGRPIDDAIVVLRANGLVAQSRFDEAESLLLPRLGSEPVRASAAQLAAEIVSNADVASRWLVAVESAIGQPSLIEHLALTEAWLALSRRLGTPALRSELDRRLADMSVRLAGDTSTNGDHWFSLALIKEQAGDVQGAKNDYRQSITASPGFAVAKNNLAMLLVADAAGLDEALKLAREAVADRNDPNYAEFLDTLGLVQLKRGDASEARQSFESAVELNPDRLDKRLNLLEALIAVGDFEAADVQLDAAQRLTTRFTPAPSLMKRLAELTALADERRPRQP
jgi:tetratricopeptide (TPR) repeat protein